MIYWKLVKSIIWARHVIERPVSESNGVSESHDFSGTVSYKKEEAEMRVKVNCTLVSLLMSVMNFF